MLFLNKIEARRVNSLRSLVPRLAERPILENWLHGNIHVLPEMVLCDWDAVRLLVAANDVDTTTFRCAALELTPCVLEYVPIKKVHLIDCGEGELARRFTTVRIGIRSLINC